MPYLVINTEAVSLALAVWYNDGEQMQVACTVQRVQIFFRGPEKSQLKKTAGFWIWNKNANHYTTRVCSFYRSIRRVVFYSLIKPTVNEKGEKEMNTISVSQALQIAGRAGRYGTQYDKVRVTDCTHYKLIHVTSSS